MHKVENCGQERRWLGQLLDCVGIRLGRLRGIGAVSTPMSARHFKLCAARMGAAGREWRQANWECDCRRQWQKSFAFINWLFAIHEQDVNRAPLGGSETPQNGMECQPWLNCALVHANGRQHELQPPTGTATATDADADADATLPH